MFLDYLQNILERKAILVHNLTTGVDKGVMLIPSGGRSQISRRSAWGVGVGVGEKEGEGVDVGVFAGVGVGWICGSICCVGGNGGDWSVSGRPISGRRLTR